MSGDTLFTRLGGRLSELFGSSKAPVEAAVTTESPRAVADALAGLHHSLDLLRGETREIGTRETDPQREARLKAEEEEAERLAIASNEEQMLQDIMALHQRLGTGIDRAELDRLHQEGLKYLEEARKLASAEDPAQRALGVVVAGIYGKAGEEAWKELGDSLAAAGLEWPDPVGLLPKASPDDRQRARDLQATRDRADFASTRAATALNRMIGKVEVWRAAYPERGSNLWQSTALRGVGAALRIRVFERAMLAAREHAPELREKLAAMLQEKLAEVNALLAKGVTSIAEADRVSREAEAITHQVAPDFIWDSVKGEVLAKR